MPQVSVPMTTVLEFHLQAGFEDAALIVEEADTVGHFRPWRVNYNARLLASDIKSYFEFNPDAVEVLIYKGKKTISVSRYQITNPLFNKIFRRKYEN